MYENGEKSGGFAQKYLTRYTHKTFFEEYMNFETHYLSHCRVIPLQSFGSHIHLQPHGLGLKINQQICMKDTVSKKGSFLIFEWQKF